MSKQKLTTSQQALVDADFSQNQAVIYTYLVTNGINTASIIARQTKIPRTLTYRVLEELEKMELVKRKDKKNYVSTFTPAHPIKLASVIDSRQDDLRQKAATVSNILTSLASTYNKTMGEPGMISFEGTEGTKTIYKDIINNNRNKNVDVIRSHLDDSKLGLDFYNNYMASRSDKQISARIITPRATTSEYPRKDIKFQLERKCIPDLEIPAEIDIYDDKVAIIAFDENLIGTIIENPAVAKTMREIFSYLWNQPDKTEDL